MGCACVITSGNTRVVMRFPGSLEPFETETLTGSTALSIASAAAGGACENVFCGALGSVVKPGAKEESLGT